MTTITEKITVGELVAQHPQTRKVLDHFGIDYCCGGNRSLEEAAAERDVDINQLRLLLRAAMDTPAQGEDERDWTGAGLGELADHIEQRHHTFMKENLPRLEGLLGKVRKAHGTSHDDVLKPLQATFAHLKEEIEGHLFKEEQILFPFLRQLDAFARKQIPRPEFHCGSVSNPIGQMICEHDNAGAALKRMRQLTSNYAVPDDGCESFRALYEGLAELEDDLHRHIHLENNILFPKAVELEAQLGLGEPTF